MADSIPGKLKEAIEQAVPALVGKVWRRDHLPDGLPLPYVTIFDGVADTPMVHGDGEGVGWIRLTQVDLWQEVLAATDQLTSQIMVAIDGLRMQPNAYAAMSCYVSSSTKIPDEEEGIDHVSITCRISHSKVKPGVVVLVGEQGPEEWHGPLRLVQPEP
jgi:hypothetical protein